MEQIDLNGIDFDPDLIFTSGQTFRWRLLSENNKTFWLGILGTYLVKISNSRIEMVNSSKSNKHDEHIDFAEVVWNYLSLDDDMTKILSTFPKDNFLLEAVNQFKGLRILQQDPWECLISFLCSINKNIPGIISIVDLLCHKFGERIMNYDRPFFSFPSPSKLANATKNELLECKLGFRWRYVNFVSKAVNSGRLDLESLRSMSYGDLRRELISDISGTTLGVGPKVADCVSLFSYHKSEAFPIDVWVLRCIQNAYSSRLFLNDLVRNKKSVTQLTYELLHDKMYQYFGRYCGYAQQFLYMKTRNDFIIQNRARV